MGKAKYKFKVVCTKLPEGVWSFSSGIGRDWRHISVFFLFVKWTIEIGWFCD